MIATNTSACCTLMCPTNCAGNHGETRIASHSDSTVTITVTATFCEPEFVPSPIPPLYDCYPRPDEQARPRPGRLEVQARGPKARRAPGVRLRERVRWAA